MNLFGSNPPILSFDWGSKAGEEEEDEAVAADMGMSNAMSPWLNCGGISPAAQPKDCKEPANEGE